MFLNILNHEQKELFQELAIKAAEANGVVEFEEKNMLKAFALEMQITPRYSTQKSSEEIVSAICKNASPAQLRAITFEILAILFSDTSFDMHEHHFFEKMTAKFHIQAETIKTMESLIQEYTDTYEKLRNFVLG